MPYDEDDENIFTIYRLEEAQDLLSKLKYNLEDNIGDITSKLTRDKRFEVALKDTNLFSEFDSCLSKLVGLKSCVDDLEEKLTVKIKEFQGKD